MPRRIITDSPESLPSEDSMSISSGTSLEEDSEVDPYLEDSLLVEWYDQAGHLHRFYGQLLVDQLNRLDGIVTIQRLTNQPP